MARATTFAEKAAKMAAKHDNEITCPLCNKPAKIIYAKVVSSVKTAKETYKYLEKNAKLCSNCLAEKGWKHTHCKRPGCNGWVQRRLPVNS